MNPYQPPAQYPNPQNAYPVLPQNPQSKYPQLPPINNHQNLPPQYPQYPHQQPQIPQGNQNNQQNPVPSNQYALIGANPIIPDSRTLLKNKIKDVEIILEKGIFWYKFWFALMVFLGGFTTGYAGVAFGFTLIYDGAYAFSYNYFALFAVILGIWMIMQCLSQRKAIEKKDLVEAKKALSSIHWFAFFYFLYVMGIFIYVQSYYSYYSSWFQRNYWTFIVSYVIPMWIHIAGARKVRNLLEKRDALALELDTRYANNL
jgi:hypothetical protein